MRGQPGAPRPLVEQLGPRERQHGAPGLAQLRRRGTRSGRARSSRPSGCPRRRRAPAARRRGTRARRRSARKRRRWVTTGCVRAEPEEEREVARRVLRLGGRQERGDARDELLPGDLLGVGVEDAERLPDELGATRGSRCAPRTAAQRPRRTSPPAAWISAPTSRTSRDLPMPGGPTTVTSCGRRSSIDLAPDRADDVQLARAPDERPEPRRPLRGLDERADGEPRPRPAPPSPSRRPAAAPRTRRRGGSPAASPCPRPACPPARPPAAGRRC